MSLFAELKRRNVIRVAIAYAVASWLLIEIASVILPIYATPDWVIKALVALIAAGLPIALLFSWVYELTPEGIKKESEVDRSQSVTGETGQRLDKITIAMLVVVGAMVILDRMLPSAPEPGSIASPEPASPAQGADPISNAAVPIADLSVAVLPFVNMSADADNEYFSDGVSEEILNVLTRIPELKVAARTSAFQFKGRNLDVAEIGRQLKVANVLEGSVRKSGDQVRITAQLIKVDDGFHLWSETYTRTLDDIFAIQDEIALAIVEALKVTLGARTSLDARLTTDPAAYNHYLKGRYFWHQRTNEGFSAAARELLRATAIDPSFARAWSALADVYVLLPEYEIENADVAIPKARAAVDRALELDARLASALTTKGYLMALHDWDPEGAEANFKRALELDPAYATGYQWYAEVLATYRRLDEAEVLARKALELDPLAPIKPMVLGNILRHMGRYDEAIAYYDLGLELAPGLPTLYYNKTLALIHSGRYEEAGRVGGQHAEALGLEAGGGTYIETVIDALAGKMTREEAIETVILAADLFCDSYQKPMWLALLGANEEAITTLEHCVNGGDVYAIHMNVLNAYEPLRPMPRFQALLRRINMPETE